MMGLFTELIEAIPAWAVIVLAGLIWIVIGTVRRIPGSIRREWLLDGALVIAGFLLALGGCDYWGLFHAVPHFYSGELREPTLSSGRENLEDMRLPSFGTPPKASSVSVIPHELLEKKEGPTFLRDVDRKITEALDKNEYFDKRYYAVPGGFALVTRIEQMESDGSPKTGPQRWSLQLPRPTFNLSSILNALFYARQGYYRFIVFIASPYILQKSKEGITPAEANAWLTGGAERLPKSVGDLDFMQADYACTALIYEFEKETEAKEAKHGCPGRIQGRTHLVKAHIWEALEEK